jgi:hypothetical protein
MHKVSIAVGSIVGALILHAVLVACGSSSASSAIPNANAGQGSACGTWQISRHYTPDVATTQHFMGGDFPAGLATPTTLPAGWEPISAQMWSADAPDGGFGYGALVMVRRCAD